LDNQLAQNPPPGGISDSMRKLFIDYYAAQMALEERFKTIDSGDTADLQRLYEGVPGLWERTCAWIVNVPAGSGAKAQKLVDKGAKVKDIPDELEGATIVADPTQSCISDSSMPAELATDIRALPLNKASDVLSLTSAGVTQSFVAEVEGRESLTFKDAKTDLVGIADSLKTQGPKAWIDLIVSTATVDSRFGSSIQNGQSGPVITPPLAPVAPASNDALPGAGQAPTATAPGAAGSDTGQ
ncbi:MAG TPA: hypothetical protein VL068_06745, partial [Microthrixaceae bacterium]|nr:hypothetical protein [Microthrixaceae bacterium]